MAITAYANWIIPSHTMLDRYSYIEPSKSQPEPPPVYARPVSCKQRCYGCMCIPGHIKFWCPAMQHAGPLMRLKSSCICLSA